MSKKLISMMLAVFMVITMLVPLNKVHAVHDVKSSKINKTFSDVVNYVKENNKVPAVFEDEYVKLELKTQEKFSGYNYNNDKLFREHLKKVTFKKGSQLYLDCLEEHLHNSEPLKNACINHGRMDP